LRILLNLTSPTSYLIGCRTSSNLSEAFAETKVVVTIQTTGVDDLAVTLADTKLPNKAAPAADSEKTVDGVVPHPP
jgi:hypothetical protein